MRIGNVINTTFNKANRLKRNFLFNTNNGIFKHHGYYICFYYGYYKEDTAVKNIILKY